MTMIWVVMMVLLGVLVVDVCLGLSARKRKMDFQFSRYNMYNQRPGSFAFTIPKDFYNLPGNQDVECKFSISKDGYLDEIRKCDTILIGGSAAFGTGSPGNAQNITGFLRAKHRLDVLNLAIPGWNFEQEIITVLMHAEVIQPKRIIFFDGANNLALALPLDYNGKQISGDPLSFYQERRYAAVINRHFDSVVDVGSLVKQTLWEIFRYSKLARFAYNVFGVVQKKKATAQELNLSDYGGCSTTATENYLRWLKVIQDWAGPKGIEIICALQPYYMHGRTMAEVHKYNFYSVNEPFDRYMLAAYEKLDAKLSCMEGITYLPLFKIMSSHSLSVFTDAVHLTREGYEIIADEIYRALFVGDSR